jgi:hypothetical protein
MMWAFFNMAVIAISFPIWNRFHTGKERFAPLETIAVMMVTGLGTALIVRFV